MSIFILGPCSIESKKLYFEAAEKLYNIMQGKDWYLKASFDKANRTSIKGERGLGLSKSISLFEEVKKEFPNIKLTTDVHECWQIKSLIGIIDVIQIPAFLCRQTDLIIECAKCFDIINVKKGQWIGPRNIIKTVDKIKMTNPNAQAWLTERGSAFGYEHLVVDFTIVDLIKNSNWDKFILDCTHSVQRSRAIYGVQGDRKLAERYFLASDILNYDGIFAEVHPKPEEAISDGDCQLFLNDIKNLINIKENIYKTLK